MKSPLNMNTNQMHMQRTFTHSWPYQFMPNYYTPAPMINNTYASPIMNIHHESFPNSLSNHVTHLSNVATIPTPNLGMRQLLIHFIKSLKFAYHFQFIHIYTIHQTINIHYTHLCDLCGQMNRTKLTHSHKNKLIFLNVSNFTVTNALKH